MGVLAAALAGLIVVNLVVFVLLLAGSRRRVRGGDIDLTAAAARGELDLRWDWPTSGTGRREPLETGDDLRYPKSKLGDVYELGQHRLVCGDATDADSVAQVVGDANVAVMVTDPPYGVGVDHRWREAAGKTRLGTAGLEAAGYEVRQQWRPRRSAHAAPDPEARGGH